MALRDAPKGSRLRRDLDNIMTAGERGRALVEQILTFSRSSVSERIAVHLEQVSREALDHLAARLPLDIDIASTLRAGRAAVLGDPTQVHQVLMNLATNAWQAMPSGGTVRVLLEPVHVDTPRLITTGTVEAGDHVVLEVADTGVGIAPDIVDRIFDPFFTTKEVGVGTGLGLSLVHSIVSDLGGAINVASTPGAGSVFTVYLPRAGDAEDVDDVDENDTPEVPRGSRERVLVVDDEEPLMRIAAQALEDFGYQPIGFTSSSAALEAFRSDPLGFDAVITDERMPGMTGSTLIHEVRSVRDRIPTMLMSGFIAGTLASKARETGADEVLRKPLSGRDLATSLARVLHRTRTNTR
jgi:CheY-like chemotaxis protein